MGSRLFLVLVLGCLFFQFLPEYCMGSIQNKGRLKLGFKGSQMTWIDQDGMILVSDNSGFAFGFHPTQDVTLFLLVVMHLSSQTVVWSANRASPVRNSDYFFFDDSGNAYLGSGGSVIWETGTAGKGVSSMELRDSGNLVLVSNDSRSIVWQSFSHPVDTLLSNQEFLEGMKLVSSQNPNNLSYSLEIKSGDVFLSAGFRSPQRYWAMSNENRKTINKVGEGVASAVLDSNSWKMYGKNKDLILEFIFSDKTDPNVTWAAVLGDDGVLTFSFLESGSSPVTSPTRIPQDECGSPAACDPYFVCYKGKQCQCPSSLPSCKPMADSLCDEPKSVELVEAGDNVSYFALGFTSPSLTTDLNGCKASCLKNCSCVAIFFDNSSDHCFFFDQIGSLQGSVKGPSFRAFVKVSTGPGTSGNGGNGMKHVPVVIAIVILTVIVILSLVYGGLRYHRRRMTKMLLSPPKESSEEEDFLEGLSGMPIRFTYKDLQNATDDFKVKLGQGGFGSVYKGVLRDGTPVAVKKLEGIGQGKKEFRAEVSTIGSIHHLHLVKLRGFCAEGAHRLLAYEYMANGSLERWLFRDNKEFMLDWDTRFSIALGTAKGLAYLHQDCDSKIVHCDIKPENVLLDEHFHAKVSDFGLAKLMTREQSHVFTTLRGTRGYLAPEWITNYAISEKSDVYSYGMVLLEIIGGRKNYDPSQSLEKSHFPTYAFKMMEEGKMDNVIDAKLKIGGSDDERVATAINVALWCIQDDMSVRPSMTKVVQMLEGVCPVVGPPTFSPLGNRLFSNAFKSFSDEATSSDYNSDLSAVRLSGPR
ncbi:unnamed protein product [Cuscuta campestris]|uniref:Receptor-like serine/threonine-protein kinase n=1 Tax=Cuscuta campestris TaxID=132261 RepID=A0A484M192_9ASTE|nr:unnamed protein product [Cuscuta campestris]